MSKKQLLLESCDFSFTCNLSEEEKNTLTESLKISAGKNGNLIVKSIPCTILDRRNQNGRIYSTALVQKAIDEARPKMKAKMLLCSYSEHPQNSFPEPKDVSHCVINAYIKNVEIEVEGKKERHNVLFNDWEILNEKSQAGAQAQQLLLSGFGVGTSIRSLGSCDPNGTVTELEYLGTDLVGQPSSATFVNSVIGESVSVAVAPENTLNETFIVSASATNVVRDLDSALVLSQQIDDANFGTVKKTSTKLDSEVDPKTGAETTMVTLETETEDEVSDIDQALMMAKQTMMNGKADIDSVTIENVKEEQPKESVENKDDEKTLNEDNDWLESDENLFKTLYHSKNGNADKNGTRFEFIPVDDENVKIITTTQVKKLNGDEEIISNDEVVSKDEARTYWHKLKASGLYDYEKAEEFKDEYVPESAMDEVVLSEPEDQHRYIISFFDEDNPLRIRAEKIYSEYKDGKMDRLNAKKALENFVYAAKLKANDGLVGESTITEAKEEDPNTGKQFVLKTKQGFVSMDGNTLTFVEKPKDAIHFVKGKEESGVVHLSGIMKILETMGIYDTEKYYKKGITDISIHDDVNVFAANVKDENKDVSEEKPVEEGVGGAILGGLAGSAVGHPIIGAAAGSLLQDKWQKGKPNDTWKAGAVLGGAAGSMVGAPTVGALAGSAIQNIWAKNKKEEATMTEDNGSNTKYQAVVETIKNDGSRASETIPVSAVDEEGINKEVGNLYDMKLQKGDQVNITVVDTSTNQSLVFNPETHSVEMTQMESAGDLEQNGNKLSMEVDDNNKVEKEFKTPAQAAVAKAGIESGKIGGDVLLSEDDEESETVKCAWCGEEAEKSVMKKEKDLGWLCNTCAKAIASREGPLTFDEDLVNDPYIYHQGKDEIDDGQEPDMDKIADSIRYIAKKTNCSLKDAMDIYEKITDFKFDRDEKDSQIDEVMYNEPGEASDPYIEKPLNEDDTPSINITFKNIDWNNEDFVNNMIGNMEDDDPVNIGDIESKVKDLPDEAIITVRVDEIPITDNAALEEFLFNKLGEKYAMKVNNAEMANVDWVA